TSSEGKKGDAVWGTRGRWTMLTGKVGDEALTIAMIDHPKNPGYPTYWHARGYGLYAANPLGQKVFSNGRETLNFTLEPHASTTVTNGEGNYMIPYLTPGKYTVTVELTGFKKLVREGIDVRIGDRLVLDLSLDVGQLEETVSVSAAAPLLEVGSGSAGQVIDE